MAANVAHTNQFIANHDIEGRGFWSDPENLCFGILAIIIASFLFAHYMQEPFIGHSTEPHVLQKEEACSKRHEHPCLCYYRVPLIGIGGRNGWITYNLTHVHCRTPKISPLVDFVDYLRYHFLVSTNPTNFKFETKCQSPSPSEQSSVDS
jgi:hypothetical protein